VVLVTVMMFALITPSASADCAEATDEELWDRAETVFEGQALDGPTSDGTLLSPARFEVYAVEPAGFDDTARSLATGERQRVAPGARSICDALLIPTPGELTFAINRRLLKGGLAVSDDEVLRAMALAFLHLKVVVEPGGAVALAAALAGRLDCRGRTVAVVLSGGNVDPALFARALTEHATDDTPAATERDAAGAAVR
jgi:threonine dehydratase